MLLGVRGGSRTTNAGDAYIPKTVEIDKEHSFCEVLAVL